MMALAPSTVQCIPARLSRVPMVVLQPASTTPEPTVLGHGSRRTASAQIALDIVGALTYVLTLGGSGPQDAQKDPDVPRPGPRNPLRPTAEHGAGLPHGAPWRRPRSSPGRDRDRRSQSPRGTVRRSGSRSRPPSPSTTRRLAPPKPRRSASRPTRRANADSPGSVSRAAALSIAAE